MILEKLKVLDIKKVGDIDEGIEAGIDNESIPFVLQMVSEKFYSNAIGSIVREITSNCFDSHIEAGVNQPVIITQSYDIEEGTSIEFKDVGAGMSTEKMVDIYRKYFKSSKRDTNRQIGAFGLGSKTPLAYADMFYITTIYNGLEYQYLFHKGENLPVLESLLGYDEVEEQYEVYQEYNEAANEWIELGEPIIKTRIVKVPIGNPTEQHNGTVIKIGIEAKDVNTFKNELKFQLAYFDDVYFSNWDISNDYDIYEGRYFKFRSDIDQLNTNIHLCIGKVRYPIDTSKVSIPKSFIGIPIAVKFEIGELQITPSRENLRYNDKDIKLIEERVNLAIQEITDIFEKQNPVIEDFETFNKLIKDIPKITFNKEKGHGLYLWDDSTIPKNYKFKPFLSLPFKKTPKNFFFLWETIGYIDSAGYHPYSYSRNIDNDFVIRNALMTLNREDRTSDYTNINISRNHHYNYKTIHLIRRKKLDFDDTIHTLGIKGVRRKFGEKLERLSVDDVTGKKVKDKSDVILTSKAKIVHEFIKITDSLIHERATSYNSYRPTQKWINEYKRSIIEASAAFIRKKNKKVFVRDAAWSFRSREFKQIELENRTGILVYGYKENQSILQSIYNTIVRSWERFRRIINREKQELACVVIQIARDNEKLIWGAKRTMYWEDFIESDFFSKILTNYRMSQYWAKNVHSHISNIKLREYLIEGFETSHDKAYNSFSKKFRAEEFYIGDKYLSDDIVDKSKFKEIDDFRMKYLYPIPLIDYVSSSIVGDEEELANLINYLKTTGIRLKNKFYWKTKKQLKEEERHKEFIYSTLELIKMFREPFKNNLLTFNQLTNVKDNQEASESCSKEDPDCSSRTIQDEEDREQTDSQYRQGEIFQDSDK